MSRGNVDFNKLQAKAKRLLTEEVPMPSLPIKRTIEQLHDTSRRLAAKTAGGPEQVPSKNKGKYLLSRKIDVVELERLKDIELKAAYIPEEPLRETDIEGLLSHHNDVIILSTIEDAKKDTEQRFKTNFTNSLEQDWEDMKKRTLESLGHPHLFAASTKDFNPRKIIEYSAVISRRQEPLLPQFIHVSRTLEFRNAPLENCWQLLNSMLEDQEARNIEPELQRINGAKRFLESQFADYIKNLVRQNPQVAELGGAPGLLNEINAYLRIINCPSLWAQVYFLLRCGDREKAESLFLERRGYALRDARGNIRTQNTDPYQEAVMNIENRTGNQPKVCRAWEDVMWFKLATLSNQANWKEELRKVQEQFDQAPPAHYNRGRNPLAFLQILLLSQQFERAIHYFLTDTPYKVEAVHFAIVLYKQRLLHESSGDVFPKEQLNGREIVRQVNMVKLIRSYAPRTPSPLDYYFLLHDENHLKECVKDHILQTGDLTPLEHFLQEDWERFRDIAIRAAETKREAGRDEDALRLYSLAKKYDQLLKILNKQLGRVIATPGPERTHWVDLARKIAGSLDETQLSELDREVLTFQKLGRLVQFFDSFYAGDWRVALERLKELKITPQDSSEVIEKIQNYKLLDESVQNNIGAILSANMDVLVHISRLWRTPDVQEDCQRWAKAIIKFCASLPGSIARDVNPKLVYSMRELENVGFSYNS